MSFLVADKSGTQTASLVPAATTPQLPAVVQKNPISVFQRQDKFDQLMELRGENAAPTKFRNRLFNHPCSWGLVAAGVAAAVGGPLVAIGLIPLAAPLIAGGAGAFLGGFLGITFLEDSPSPVSVLARNNALRQRDLKFLSGSAESGPLQQAIDGQLAARWIARIDRQRVHGEAACADLEDIVSHSKTLPAEIRKRAERVVAVYDATVDDSGRRPKELSDYRVSSIIESVRRLDDADAPGCAAELMKSYFKGDVPRYRCETHGKSRDLYRALREAMRPKAEVVPALPAPAVNTAE